MFQPFIPTGFLNRFGSKLLVALLCLQLPVFDTPVLASSPAAIGMGAVDSTNSDAGTTSKDTRDTDKASEKEAKRLTKEKAKEAAKEAKEAEKKAKAAEKSAEEAAKKSREAEKRAKKVEKQSKQLERKSKNKELKDNQLNKAEKKDQKKVWDADKKADHAKSKAKRAKKKADRAEEKADLKAREVDKGESKTQKHQDQYPDAPTVEKEKVREEKLETKQDKQDQSLVREGKSEELKDVKEEKKEQKTDRKSSEEATKSKSDERNKVRGDAPCTSWVKFGQPIKSVLLCVHGLGLNSSSYEQFGKDLSSLGIAVYAIDVRGFGSWMEAKGHTKVNFDDCIEDVQKTLEWLQKANPGKPVFLLGESMGGAIVLHAAAKYPDLMNGVISACSSADRFKQKRTDLKIFLHALTGPTRPMNIGKTVVSQAAGDNEKLKEVWEGDELDRMKLSPLELMHFQSFMNDTHDQVVKIKSMPVLMVQGTADQLVKPEGTEELYNELATKDKQMMWVQDAQHLIFENQQCPPATLNAVAKWILNRSPQVDIFAKARTAFDSGKYQDALQIVKEILLTSPNNADAHLLMGRIQMKLKHHLIARQHLVLATRLGKGTSIPGDANKYLMALPQGFVGPRLASAAAKAKTSIKPTALIFNATWCRPCQDMNDVVEKARAKIGNLVDFKIIDVDDSSNDALVEQYSIGPVPTTVFLSSDGQVAAYQVGYDDGLDGMLRGVAKILPHPGSPVNAVVKQVVKNSNPAGKSAVRPVVKSMLKKAAAAQARRRASLPVTGNPSQSGALRTAAPASPQTTPLASPKP